MAWIRFDACIPREPSSCVHNHQQRLSPGAVTPVAALARPFTHDISRTLDIGLSSYVPAWR